MNNLLTSYILIDIDRAYTRF